MGANGGQNDNRRFHFSSLFRAQTMRNTHLRSTSYEIQRGYEWKIRFIRVNKNTREIVNHDLTRKN